MSDAANNSKSRDAKSRKVSFKSTGVEVKVGDSRELHEPQIDSRNLQYSQVDEIEDVKVYTTDAVDFPLDPDERVLTRLKGIKKDDSAVVRYAKLISTVGINPVLIKLIFRGIGSGLAHGTMDIIYRINAPKRVKEVLDNLDIAVGSLQRRLIVSDLIAKILSQGEYEKIISVAGGSCLLPIEGIYQSGREGLQIVNIDNSSSAYKKALNTLTEINAKKNIGLSLSFEERDILEEGLGIDSDDNEAQVFECTGFWEYLDDSQRDDLLYQVKSSLGESDYFVLTAMVDNPQKDIFDAMQFKKLKPHNINNFLSKVQKYFNVDFAVLNGNATYLTLVLKAEK
jgi:hypothetical protein